MVVIKLTMSLEPCGKYLENLKKVFKTLCIRGWDLMKKNTNKEDTLRDLKNVKNIHGGVLLLVKLQATPNCATHHI